MRVVRVGGGEGRGGEMGVDEDGVDQMVEECVGGGGEEGGLQPAE